LFVVVCCLIFVCSIYLFVICLIIYGSFVQKLCIHLELCNHRELENGLFDRSFGALSAWRHCKAEAAAGGYVVSPNAIRRCARSLRCADCAISNVSNRSRAIFAICEFPRPWLPRCERLGTRPRSPIGALQSNRLGGNSAKCIDGRTACHGECARLSRDWNQNRAKIETGDGARGISHGASRSDQTARIRVSIPHRGGSRHAPKNDAGAIIYRSSH
jgi:hypothetical protein